MHVVALPAPPYNSPNPAISPKAAGIIGGSPPLQVEKTEAAFVIQGLDMSTFTSNPNASVANFRAVLASATCKFLGIAIENCVSGDIKQGSVAGNVLTTWPSSTNAETAANKARDLSANGGASVLTAIQQAGYPATGISITDVTQYDTNDDTKKRLAIGLGVGLGVGIPVVAAIIFFCIWKSKRSAAGVVAPRADVSQA